MNNFIFVFEAKSGAIVHEIRGEAETFLDALIKAKQLSEEKAAMVAAGGFPDFITCYPVTKETYLHKQGATHEVKREPYTWKKEESKYILFEVQPDGGNVFVKVFATNNLDNWLLINTQFGKNYAVYKFACSYRLQ